ncbi:MAG: hypothetical protein J1G38_05325 [Clostridiales bacterium]|nr:hypothetical protein [Clostridiales bacterium]
MKKAVVVEILLLLILAVSIACAVEFFVVYNDTMNHVYHLVEGTPFLVQYDVKDVSSLMICGIFSILAALAALAIMIIIAIKDFPVVKQYINNLKAKRAVAKSEKAEADKQARIEKLQAELDELKKNE